MLKSILKLVLRGWLRDKTTVLIHILGLSISLFVVMTLAFYLHDELQADRFHQNLERIYGVNHTHETRPDSLQTTMPVEVPGMLRDRVPQIEEIVRMKSPWTVPILSVDGREGMESNLLFADPSFFRVFTYEAVDGDLSVALENPMSIVLTASEARRFFGSENPIGKILRLDDAYELTVTAVIGDSQVQSTFDFRGIVSLSSLNAIDPFSMKGTWQAANFRVFALLKAGTDPAEVAELGKSVLPDSGYYKDLRFKFVPFTDHYFHFPEKEFTFLVHGSMAKMRVFLLIAALILVLAIINFVNLSNAKWMFRRHEAGLFRALGAERRHLLLRFMMESGLIAVIAFIVAICAIEIGLSRLAGWLELPINNRLIMQPEALFASTAAVLIGGLLAGIWPGLRFASGAPNERNQGNARATAPLILFALQFTIAIVLMVCTLLVNNQIRYGNSDWGLQSSHILGIKLNSALTDQKELLRNQLMGVSGVEEAVFSRFHPGDWNSHWKTEMKTPEGTKWVSFQLIYTESKLLEMLNLELLSGRFFNSDRRDDEDEVILNESAVEAFGLEHPLGTLIRNSKGKWSEVVGVIKDFHYESKHELISPLVFMYRPYSSWCYVELVSGSFAQTQDQVKAIERTVKDLAPAFPPELEWMDQSIERLYRSELRFQKQILFFSISAIVLSCMGLFGLSVFSAQRRTKEIGVRKVCGASVLRIVALLVNEYAGAVIVANALAWPIACYAIHQWLEHFAYRAPISPWAFLYAGCLALVIALITIGSQAIRAATANPVESLRYE